MTIKKTMQVFVLLCVCTLGLFAQGKSNTALILQPKGFYCGPFTVTDVKTTSMFSLARLDIMIKPYIGPSSPKLVPTVELLNVRFDVANSVVIMEFDPTLVYLYVTDPDEFKLIQEWVEKRTSGEIWGAIDGSWLKVVIH